ncbi:MraY family glycosyltransferase [Pyrococcus yayanosii]|uniref:Evolution of Prochlorococcus n=1 Tax=Pyrococcus yayanosii (strain CH1 / JCM 16557) TaxID=529709 RepID=F8AG03_PYRYC|nr:glycosyltransferase 4 family protein [Pyrococcus yayanosii]AEH25057.1 evolution of Prochlorococcus [Pyrococcus yayanosii CH1]
MKELLAFPLTVLITPYIAHLMGKAGIVGRDIHKPGKPEVPEMGGLAMLLSVGIAGLIAGVEELSLIIYLLFGLIGVLDDLTALRQSHKVALSLFASLPLLLRPPSEVLHFPGLEVQLGPLMGLVAVLYVTASANLVNMLAGFNGLEAGTSAIMFAALALITGGAARSLALLGLSTSLGFLLWNRYPARVFPGDTGTLSLGALFGLVAVLGGAEFWGAVLLIPHALDFLLKLRVKFSGKKMGGARIRPDGTLEAPPYLSFLGFLMRTFRLTEPRLVALVWLIEGLIAIIVILLA